MGAASWKGHPWVSIGSTRMRLDGPSIEVHDPTPGLAWQQDEVSWRAGMARGHGIGHTCPEGGGAWLRGRLDECARGTLLAGGEYVVCVGVIPRRPHTVPKSIASLTRHCMRHCTRHGWARMGTARL